MELEPACTEAGRRVQICSVCGGVIRTEEIEAVGHTLGEWAVEYPPTCTEEGMQHKYCIKCGAYQFSMYPPATGHDEEWVIITLATCTETGEKELICGLCGEVLQTEEIPAAGHDGDQWKITKPATGKHTYGAWKVTRAATALANGIKTRACTKCGHKETATIAKLKPTITVNVKTLPMKVGQTSTAVKVSGLAKGDYVKSWKSSNTAIVKADSKGKLTAQKKTGTATITITLASKKTATVKVTVQKGTVRTTSVSVMPKSFTLQKGKSKKLTWVIYPLTSQEKVTFTTSNKKVATVSSTGNVTAKGKGTAKITVKSGSKKAVVTVTVK